MAKPSFPGTWRHSLLDRSPESAGYGFDWRPDVRPSKITHAALSGMVGAASELFPWITSPLRLLQGRAPEGKRESFT